jgi:hypothetical protein
MPDATITSTASTFGTISGTFAADQSTIVGTVTGIVAGTLDGSVGVPGPAGPAGIGLPAGGTSGQFLQKTSSTDYATDWVTVNLTGLATESWVTAGFYPLTGNPSGFLTDAPSNGNLYARKDGSWEAFSVPSPYITSVVSPLSVTSGELNIDLTTYAPKASPALTGNVTITSNSTGAALFIEQAGTGNILTLHDQATDTNFVAIDQNGKVNTIPSVTASSGFNIPHGTAPTSPVNGDVWTTTSGLFMRQNGSTKQYVDLDGTQTINGAKTFSGANQTLGNATSAGTINIGSGATVSGATKAVNIGTAGVSGSTTNITIGSTTGTSTTTLHGTINATASIAADTNSTIVATTAFVAGQAGTATPLVNGTAAAGTSLRYARQDHVHPTDTTRAPLASPALTGTPTSTTAAADTNTTQIATTAYVVGQAGSATPLVDGTAAVGTSIRFARQDHVHPTDTSRAALASPTFTGVPAAPTAAVDTNTTQLATTAYVVGQGYLKSATASSTYAPLASPIFTGTPSLPTGTTGVTQTAGNNTTALATTAFVTAATPAASTTVAGLLELATRLEVVEPSSSTLAVSPMRALDVLMNPGYVQIAQNNGNVSTATVGTGAGVFTTSMTRVCLGPNVSVAGSSYYRPQTNGGVAQFYAKGINNASINFSKPFWMSGRSCYDDTFRGDANNTSRITVGKSATGVGALAQKGIGWQKVGGLAPNFFLLAHNGTTLTSVDTSTSLNSLGITGGVPFDWSLYSDGSGNVTMFINNVQVATTSAGPTGYSTGSSVWQEEVDQSASAATRMYLTTFGGHYYHA